MSWTYDFANFPAQANTRFLAGDTDPLTPIFSDDEVNAALNNESSQNVIVGLSGYAPANPPKLVYPYRRAAAWLLNGLAASQARLASVVSILDVKLSVKDAAICLRDQAKELIDQEASAGYFAVAEMVPNNFAMRERLTAMLFRQNN